MAVLSLLALGVSACAPRKNPPPPSGSPGGFSGASSPDRPAHPALAQASEFQLQPRSDRARHLSRRREHQHGPDNIPVLGDAANPASPPSMALARRIWRARPGPAGRCSPWPPGSHKGQTRMNAVIQAHELSRWYGIVMGLNNVSFDIAPGLTGLVGPNGAGKSTLIQIITGQLQPSSGPLTVFGQTPGTIPPCSSASASARKREAVPKDLRPLDWLTRPGRAFRPGRGGNPRPAAKRCWTRSNLPREHWSKTHGPVFQRHETARQAGPGPPARAGPAGAGRADERPGPMGRQEMAGHARGTGRRAASASSFPATSWPSWNRSAATSSFSTGAASWPPAVKKKSAATSKTGPRNCPSTATPRKNWRATSSRPACCSASIWIRPRACCASASRTPPPSTRLDRPAAGQPGDGAWHPQPKPVLAEYL